MTRTLLLITPGFVARGEFDARGRLVAFGRAAAPPGAADAGSLTLAALGLVKARARKVWVLSTAAVTAIVEVSANRLQGVSEQERFTALAFEAEALTGVPAGSSLTVARRLGGDSVAETWWVTQVSERLHQEVDAELVRHGAQLAGLAHPGGMVLTGENAAGGDVLEVWEDLLFLRQRHRGAAMLDILPAELSGGLDMLLARFPSPEAEAGKLPREVWTTRSGLSASAATVRSLQDAETLQGWFSGWLSALDQSPEPLPVLHPPARPMSTARRVLLCALATGLALLLCAGNWWWTELQLNLTQDEAKKLSEAGNLRSEVQKVSQELQKARTDHEADMTRHSQTLRGFGAMLEALALEKPGGVLVRALSAPANVTQPAPGKPPVMETTLTGWCAEENLAAQFSQKVGARLQPLGWTVQPARTQAQLAGSTPVWSFEIHLRMEATTPAAKP
jgi:hypothetical protein